MNRVAAVLVTALAVGAPTLAVAPHGDPAAAAGPARDGAGRGVVVVPPVIPLDEPVVVAAALRPAERGRRVVLQRWLDGSWSVVERSRTDARGGVLFDLGPQEEGVHRFRAVARRASGSPRVRTRPAATRVAPRVEELTATLRETAAYGQHSDLDVSADGRFVSFHSNRAGAEGPQVFLWDRTRRRLRLLSPRGSEETWGGSLSADGASAAVITRNEDVRPSVQGRTDYPFTALVETATGRAAPLVTDTGQFPESVGVELSHDASQLLSVHPRGGYVLTDLVRGRTRELTDRFTDHAVSSPDLAAGGRHAVWTRQVQDPVTRERSSVVELWTRGAGRAVLDTPGYEKAGGPQVSGDGALVVLTAVRPGTEGPSAVTDVLLVRTADRTVLNLSADLPRGARSGPFSDDGSVVYLDTEHGPQAYLVREGERVAVDPAPTFFDELDETSVDGSVLVHVDGPTVTTYMPRQVPRPPA